jgi:hypothetical protein
MIKSEFSKPLFTVNTYTSSFSLPWLLSDSTLLTVAGRRHYRVFFCVSFTAYLKMSFFLAFSAFLPLSWTLHQF